MKRSSIWISIICLALTMMGVVSCEKMQTDDSGTPTNLTSANLILRIVTDASRTGSDTSPWATLHFVAFQDGSKKQGITQKSSDDGFGEAAMTLPAGTYQVLVLAHSSGNPSLTDAKKIQFDNADGFSDTFYYYGDIEVTTTPATHNIKMVRATAKVQFATTDAIPAEVKSMMFYYTGGSGALDATTGLGCVASKQRVIVDIDDTQTGKPLSVDLYTIPRSDAGGMLSLNVKAFSAPQAGGNILYEKDFEQLAVERNCITDCSGAFFNNGSNESSSCSFIISADTSWGSVNEYHY